MFAKVFGQIFDSSIAEDYNCRRMFMDLLVLADSSGTVDMTFEAIARRTNVPLEEVRRYIAELCQPDTASRSQIAEGKRLIPIDDSREWGWIIVNYRRYRDLRDKEALRNYFRNQQREYRARQKQNVKDGGLTDQDIFDKARQSLTSASASSSVLSEGVRGRFLEWMEFRKSNGRKIKRWDALFDSQAKWLTKFSESEQLEILEQSMRNGWQGLFELKQNGRPSRQMSAFEIEKRCAAITTQINKIFQKNGNQRLDGDGIEDLKQRRDELKKMLTQW